MGKKAPKASRKLAAKGDIKRQIQDRHKNRKLKKQIQNRKDKAKTKAKAKENVPADGNDKEESDAEEAQDKFKGMSVDDFLGAGFMAEGDENGEGSGEEEDSDDAGSDISEGDSFASVDDLSDEGETHMHELAQLAEKDPEFFKYLQENDQDLLEFDPNTRGDDVMGDGDENVEMDERPVLTQEILKSWQKALLEQRSLRALRKLLVAFRTAAHVQDDEDETRHTRLAWRIDDLTIYRKLVSTALRYTPVILGHHIPYKTLPNGKFKQPATSKKFTGLTKLLLSHFHHVVRVIETLPHHRSSEEEDEEGKDVQMTILALRESAKLLPYIVGSRKAVKMYLKMCLDLWSSAQDDVRMAAFLAIRRLASSNDEAILDLILKGSYLTLVRSCKATSAHTLPSITLMKNSATELYCVRDDDVDMAVYQHAFRYIRQLAILLRGSLKSKTKESQQQVYNWQYAHCVDFWTLVLARACSRDVAMPRKSDLGALMYPLIHVTLGAIQLNANAARSFPFQLHLLRSLLHLSRHTETYIPLAPHLLPIIEYALSPGTSGKNSGTLRPVAFDTTIRVSAAYLRTRIYAESLAEEAVYVLAAWLGAPQMQGSVVFPEMSVPVSMALRRAVKDARGKAANEVKRLLERMEEGRKWVEERRRGSGLAPSDVAAVRAWEGEKLSGESPLGKAVKMLGKARERRRTLLDKARDGEDEILEE